MSNVGSKFGQTHSSQAKKKKGIINEAGYAAFNLPLEELYLQMLMTNTLGNTFYVKSEDLVERSVQLHRDMVQYDPAFMAKAIVYARKYGYMRTQPIMGLAMLTTSPVNTYKRMARYIAPAVIRTPNDLIDFVTIVGAFRQGRGLGSSVKTLINSWLNTRLTEYQALKYGGEKKPGLKCSQCGHVMNIPSGKTITRCPNCRRYNCMDVITYWSLRDILRASRPRPINTQRSNLFTYLVHGADGVDLSDLPQLAKAEELKNLVKGFDAGEIPESIFSERALKCIQDGRLPYEVVTGIMSKNAPVGLWEYLMKQMPIFALLRNLNTLSRHKVLDKAANIEYVISRLTNPEAVSKSMIFPGQIVTAFDNYQGNNRIKDAIRDMAELAVANIPEIAGRTHIFLDISGSMTEEYKKHGGVLGCGLLKKAPDSEFWCFGYQLHYPNISRRDSLLSNVERVMRMYGGGTNTSYCLEHMLGNTSNATNRYGYSNSGSIYDSGTTDTVKASEPIYTDNIIILTDEQQNHGSPVVNRFREYRKNVNPNARLFIIDVAPYQGHLAEKDEPGVYFIFGWSDDVLRYISQVTKGFHTQTDDVARRKLSNLLFS